MTTHMPPHQYFERDYLPDFEVFGGDMMCGISLGESLRPPKRARFVGLTEFVVCQFELNLLSQAVYTHSCSAYAIWRRFSAPFADTRLCFSGHGMGSHAPSSILRFAQQPFAAPNIAPVSLGWDILRDYTTFFLDDYVARFMASETGMEFSREAFLQAVARDHDCTAHVLTPSGWQSRHVIEFLGHEHTAV